jgi:hypothetical protein
MGHVTTLAPLAKCTTRGCAWRFASGPDRICPACRDGDTPALVDRAATYGALLAAAPGERSGDGEQTSVSNANDHRQPVVRTANDSANQQGPADG